VAIFHSSAKIISRSSGHQAVQAAAYRAGARLACAVSGLVFDFRRKRHVGPCWIQAPAGSPAWALSRASLWSAAEAAERRVNSQLSREITLALPLNFDPRTQERVLREYVQANFVAMGMAADVAIHHKPGNPHAHILLSLRAIESEGFGAKRREWNDAALIVKWREAWANLCNRELAALGSDARIDHRSHAERGIQEAPTVHVGRSKSVGLAETAYRLALNTWRRTVSAWKSTRAELIALRALADALRSEVVPANSLEASTRSRSAGGTGQVAASVTPVTNAHKPTTSETAPRSLSTAMQRLICQSLDRVIPSTAQQLGGKQPEPQGGPNAVATT
jgi:hypothetical protein